MHSVLPITVTVALCFLTFPSSLASSIKGVDALLSKGQSDPLLKEGEVRYVDNRKSITLTCFGKLDGNSGVELEWFKNNESLIQKCASEMYNDINRKTGKETLVKRCVIEASKEDEKVDGHWGRLLTLRFNKVQPGDFSAYECRGNFTMKSLKSGNQNHVMRRVYLWETITATRLYATGKRQRSVLVYEGNEFYIYCNFTGLRSDLEIKWYKDGQDITKDLRNGEGNFTCGPTNETDSDEGGSNLCVRIANMKKHRGIYTCTVNKSDDLGYLNDLFKYPIEHSYMIRVKATASLLFPGIILVVECIILGIITLITWKNTSSGDQLDGNDWEDDDENDPEENHEDREEEEEELTSKPLTDG